MFCLPTHIASRVRYCLLLTTTISALVVPTTFAMNAQDAGSSKVSRDSNQIDWRKKIGTFRVGIVGGNRPILNTRRALPFKEALQKALGMRVEIFALRDQRALVDAHVGGRIEYAVYSASAYGMAWAKCKCIEPLAVPTSMNGAKGFESILLAKKSQTNSLADLKGKKIAIPGKSSFSGYILPEYLLEKFGTKFDAFGWELNFVATTQQAANALSSSKAAATFGWQSVPAKKQKDQNTNGQKKAQGTLGLIPPKERQNYHILWKSDFIPHGPHSIRRELDPQVKAIVKTFLSQLKQANPVANGAIAPLLSGGFEPISHRDYRLVLDMVEKATDAGDAPIKALNKSSASDT